MQLSELYFHIEDYLLFCKSKNLARKTLKSYEQSLKLFERWAYDNKIDNVDKITATVITKYIHSLQTRGKYEVVGNETSRCSNFPENRTDLGKPISTTTINNYIRNLKAFCSYCYELDLIKENPMKKIKQLPNKRTPKNFITDEQYNTLLRAMNLDIFPERRDFVIINLLFDTGMRITECLLIQVKDIDLTKRCIFLPAEHTKGKQNRYVFYSSEMAKIIRQWLKFKDLYTESDFLFSTSRGNKLKNTYFESNFRKYIKRVGLENITPHCLRNNFAKRFLMAGGNIYVLSKILGHSSVVVTEKAYLDLTTDDIRQTYQAFSPLSVMKKK